MRIGVPKETKNHEYRVGLTPAGVTSLTKSGHEVWVEYDAGAAIGFSDSQYQQAGASLVSSTNAFSADLVIKVKEPSLEECEHFKPGQTLFTYLHLAAAQAQALALKRSGCTAIAYETVEDEEGRLPLLQPMSQIAGRMSIQVGATALQRNHGGRGTLLGGVPGVAPGKVVILGGGVAGTHAAQMAVGLQADVTIIEKSPARIAELESEFAGRTCVLMASEDNVANTVRSADLVVGSVLVPGAQAPKLVTRELVQAMQKGSAMVDIAIDQGGCFETSRPTSHDDPMYIDEGVVHYCVTNMPGGVARTSTEALCAVTLPYIESLANHGVKHALKQDAGLGKGVNVCAGRIVHPVVEEALSRAA